MDTGILTHGSLSQPTKGVQLRAGRLTALYESGFIRYIYNGRSEIVRMVNHYLRDQNWNTIPMQIHSEQIATTTDSFQVKYAAVIKQSDIDFSWQCTITGKADETIVFAIDGEAHSTFMRNRLGLTVLLPAGSLRGQTCRITHASNATGELPFPDLISPHQPFLDIQSMAWSPASGVQAAMTFEGDIFEMEDQRNWLDASHKVYCTPLSLGFPKEVKKGDRIAQSVHLKVFGDLHQPESTEESITFSIEKLKGEKLPEIGIPLSELRMTPKHMEYIAALAPDFVSVSVRSVQDIKQRVPEALQISGKVEVVVFPAADVPEDIALALKPYAQGITRVIILVEGKRSADGALVDSFVPALRKHLPKARVGSGTDAFFTELNRNPTPATSLDFLSFSVNPQCHASDLRTMTENLTAHSDVVETCRAISGGRDVRVGPVTLKMRWNPDARTGEVDSPGALPANVDARQLSLYAAGWTLGSLKYLTDSGANTATYFELAGWRGLMAHSDQKWPAAFGVHDEQVYPVYLMLRLLLSQRNAAVFPLKSTHPLQLDGMAFHLGREILVVIANYTETSLRVAIPHGLGASKVLVVGSDNVMNILSDPLRFPSLESFDGDSCTIPPFGFAVVKGNE